MPADLPQEGWYRDPDGSPRPRYWDGSAWTGHYAPAPPEQREAAQRTAAVVAERPPGEPVEEAGEPVAQVGAVAQQRLVTGAEPVQQPVVPAAVAGPVQQSAAGAINGHAAMQTASGGLPPADWYPDPAGSGKERYWDGAAWTGELQGKPAGGSGALGILGLLTALFLAPIGIVIGLLLLSKGQRKDGWIVIGIGSAILLAILIGTQ